MSGGRNPILTRVFALVGIAVISVGTIFTLELIYDIWYPPFFRPAIKESNAKYERMKALAKDIEQDNLSIAYRMPDQMADGTLFHEIKLPANKDKVSLCITCHGLLPHMESKEMRAFRNKHSDNIACETCHMEGGGTPSFKWYNVITGTIVPKVEVNGVLIDSDYKIIALYGADKNALGYRKVEMIANASKLLSEADSMSTSERRQAIKPFHENLRKPKSAVDCASCHNASKASFLPLATLGYPERRIQSLMSSEIIGMLTKYKEFYLPSFLSNKPADNEGAGAR